MNTHVATTPFDSVETILNFADPSQKLAYMDDAVKGNAKIRTIPYPVKIHNARLSVADFTLEKNAFTLVKMTSSVRDFTDLENVRQVYFEEVVNVIKQQTNATHVVVFGEQLRGGSEGGVARVRTPAMNVHVDYDTPTAHAIAEHLVPEQERQRLLNGRWMIINVWRPIKPVQRHPLTVLDGSTIDRNDQHLCKLLATRSGVSPAFGFNISYNEKQRWYYYPAMQPDEMLLFKLVDSDAEAVQWAGHSAFDDPTSAADAPARESLEVRTIAFIPNP